MIQSFLKLNKIFICIFFVFVATNFSFGQIRVSGVIKDASSGERLIGATVIDTITNIGTITNKEGQFLIIAKEKANLKISYIGYITKHINISIKSDTLINILLQPKENLLEEVTIVGKLLSRDLNIVNLSVEDIVNTPNLTGKPDVLKALQLQPGIRSQGEMSSVTLVRGGNPGENLYLIDNTPLIYVHHIGGYMSIFNTDMIKDVEAYKGSFPAKYGERLSSIINISQKEGDKKDLLGTLSIGISDISFSIEGPTKLKNSSFIVAGRKTIVDLYYMFVSGLFDKRSDLFLTYGFHDINGKFSWDINDKNSIHFNIYQGDDYMSILPKWGGRNQSKVANTWGNWLLAADWSYTSSKIFVKNTLSYTYYRLKNKTLIRMENEDSKHIMRSYVQDVSLRTDANYLVNNSWNIDFGTKFSYLQYAPASYKNTQVSQKYTSDIIDAMESAIYFSNNIRLFKYLDADIGLRVVNYFNKEICKFSFEPRVDISYSIKGNSKFNVSYMRVNQNAQLIYNTGSLTANEIYVPSGKDIPISFSDQFSVGWSMSFMQQMFVAEANIYYKTLNRLTTYKEGYGYSSGDMNWRDKLVSGGTGIAKGVELMFKKQRGKFTGFISYALSKSTREFKEINGGKKYPFSFDSPHAVSLSVSYKISDKWSFSASWQFQSGLPYTPVIGRYNTIEMDPQTGQYSTFEVLVYGDKNSARMRTYHRLDFAFKYTKYTKKRHNKSEWVFGLYNAYNRQNPYFYYYNSASDINLGIWNAHNPRTDGFSPIILSQISLFQIMPMISYKIWFGSKYKQKL